MTQISSPRLIDPHHRTIDYLRLSITDLCNLRCSYCMPAEGVRKLSHDEILRQEEFVAVARAAVECGVRKVRITGGEPLVKKNIVSLVEELASIEGLQTLAMTTNATLLAPLAADLYRAGLRHLNISIDTLNPSRFRVITRRDKLSAALEGFHAALAAGFHVKLNTVILHREFDDYRRIIDLARTHQVSVRFIEQMDFGSNRGAGFIAESELVEFLSRDSEVQPLEPEPSHLHVRYYRVDGHEVGFISPRSGHFCGSCNKLRLTPHGRLRFCLAAEEHIDLRTLLRSDPSADELRQAIVVAVGQKPLAGPWENAQSMWRIGG